MGEAMKVMTVCLIAVATLAACKHEGAAVQKQYAADRNECRQYAEYTVGMSRKGAPAGYMPSGREHIALVDQFARCMHKRGWAVNKPPKEGEE
jgi:hypothetical protein